MKSKKLLIGILMVSTFFLLGGCGAPKKGRPIPKTGSNRIQAEKKTEDSLPDAPKEKTKDPKEVPTKSKHPLIKKDSVYDCDFEKDLKEYQGKKPDIVVGDHHYATQINDWYMNFKDYEGKIVEIEGYYIEQFPPYQYIGRKGPSCPYCQGGYVSFEIALNHQVTGINSEKDWIKVIGILRRGIDTTNGEFYFIEVLSMEKMPQVGVATVTD